MKFTKYDNRKLQIWNLHIDNMFTFYKKKKNKKTKKQKTKKKNDQFYNKYYSLIP